MMTARNKAWQDRFIGEKQESMYGLPEAEQATEEAGKPRDMRIAELKANRNAEVQKAQQLKQQQQNTDQQRQAASPGVLADGVPTGHLKGMLSPEYKIGQ
jgi:hypothetical protein